MTHLPAEVRGVWAAQAFDADAAVPATSRRHLRLDDDPLVIAPLELAGENAALTAVAIGTDPDHPTVLVCPEPRDSRLQLALLNELARHVCDHLDPLAADREPVTAPDGPTENPARRAGQLVVPTPAAVELLLRVAERMTWSARRAEEDPDAAPHVDPILQRGGGWLIQLCDHHPLRPDSGLLVVASDAVRAHWIVPLADHEALHLPALMAAVTAPAGSCHASAWAAEDEIGGVVTTPRFDRAVLAPAVEEFNRRRQGAIDAATVSRHESVVRQVIEPEATAMYEATHQAIDLLRTLAPLAAVDTARPEALRVVRERRAFTRMADYLDGPARFAKTDSPRRAVHLLAQAEEEEKQVHQERLRGDPRVRRAHAVTGATLDGTVVVADSVQRRAKVNMTSRSRLVVEVPGRWVPNLGQTYELLDHPGPVLFRLEEAPYDAEADSTTVTLVCTGKGANQRVENNLAAGDPVAFAPHEPDYPWLSLPADTPALLAEPEAP